MKETTAVLLCNASAECVRCSSENCKPIQFFLFFGSTRERCHIFVRCRQNRCG